ncbi:hypothetical protein M378DRAFT_561544 [Amanita muscaria Koide BX008]|uniref:Uncharacterized protein n=1 Tax=Amanita muscaria (strain Koide BX008) TaxID=946122 RepID=A0A0C2RZL2_AMAMK|nr:hypothetical protein M378DRAFT_561544 [Amanita muscaria Koide BX008]
MQAAVLACMKILRTSIFQPDANVEENSRIQICCDVVVFVLEMSICSSQLVIGSYDSEVETFDVFCEAFNRRKPYRIYPSYLKVPMRIQRKIPCPSIWFFSVISLSTCYVMHLNTSGKIIY